MVSGTAGIRGRSFAWHLTYRPEWNICHNSHRARARVGGTASMERSRSGRNFSYRVALARRGQPPKQQAASGCGTGSSPPFWMTSQRCSNLGHVICSPSQKITSSEKSSAPQACQGIRVENYEIQSRFEQPRRESTHLAPSTSPLLCRALSASLLVP